MTAPKQAVRVTIGGEDYTVRSELPPEYTREVAAYVDAEHALAQARASSISLSLGTTLSTNPRLLASSAPTSSPV